MASKAPPVMLVSAAWLLVACYELRTPVVCLELHPMLAWVVALVA